MNILALLIATLVSAFNCRLGEGVGDSVSCKVDGRIIAFLDSFPMSYPVIASQYSFVSGKGRVIAFQGDRFRAFSLTRNGNKLWDKMIWESGVAGRVDTVIWPESAIRFNNSSVLVNDEMDKQCVLISFDSAWHVLDRAICGAVEVSGQLDPNLQISSWAQIREVAEERRNFLVRQDFEVGFDLGGVIGRAKKFLRSDRFVLDGKYSPLYFWVADGESLTLRKFKMQGLHDFSSEFHYYPYNDSMVLGCGDSSCVLANLNDNSWHQYFVRPKRPGFRKPFVRPYFGPTGIFLFAMGTDPCGGGSNECLDPKRIFERPALDSGVMLPVTTELRRIRPQDLLRYIPPPKSKK